MHLALHHFIMQQLTIVLVCSIALVVAGPAEDRYSDRYDSVNIDQILASDRLLNNYFKCLMDRGSCTSEGSELKSVLPDALEQGCSKCTPKQKDATEKVIRFLIDNRPEQWMELQAKYDPNGVYRQRYEAEANRRGVRV
ncbi:hypothetical protein B566_EDAN014482 [Ephemera danica]|nr:hypothetical protein B566_EDAN014482 [Ephemera danica]